MPDELLAYSRIRKDPGVSVGTSPALPLGSVLWSQVTFGRAHVHHLGIVRLKHWCHNVVWWPGIHWEIRTLVKECNCCLLSGKNRASAPPPPVHPLDWPSQPWEHLQLDICSELHGVPHHQWFLVVVYNLHSKWPEVTPVGSVTSSVD